MNEQFTDRLYYLKKTHQELIELENSQLNSTNGIYCRYQNPILTAEHIPLEWRYDLNPITNPDLMERIGINAVFNSGAIKLNDKYILVARVEASNRKSFMAIAESENGYDNFIFHEYPLLIPLSDEEETNVYDMRLVKHEDGWIYGIFCSEKRDPEAKVGDQAAAVAQCGLVRTKDLLEWERLPNLQTLSPQQRNVVLHPEFVDHQYAFYTRPQDRFIEAGTGGGIGFGLCKDISKAIINQEIVIDAKKYHTVYESKNGLGPAPIKTEKGWLHLAHGVRNTAAGLRYVLYIFITDLNDLSKVIYKPGGYFMAPQNEERIGDVSNVLFSNGWIEDEDGKVFIYYGASDSRMYVAATTIQKLLDYAINTPEDGFTSHSTVMDVMNLINRNKTLGHYSMDQILNHHSS